MLKYESSTRILEFKKKVILSDGSTPMELNGKLDLSAMSEPERQRIIAVAKLTTQWCNGHDIEQSQTLKQKDKEDVILRSPLDKAKSILERDLSQTKVDPSVASDVAKSDSETE